MSEGCILVEGLEGQGVGSREGARRSGRNGVRVRKQARDRRGACIGGKGCTVAVAAGRRQGCRRHPDGCSAAAARAASARPQPRRRRLKRTQLEQEAGAGCSSRGRPLFRGGRPLSRARPRSRGSSLAPPSWQGRPAPPAAPPRRPGRRQGAAARALVRGSGPGGGAGCCMAAAACQPRAWFAHACSYAPALSHTRPH